MNGPIDVSDWDCMNCGGEMRPAAKGDDVEAICVDCGFVEII